MTTDMLPPHIAPLFEKLCSSFPPDTIPDLRKGVDAAVARLLSAKDEYLGPNVDLARQLADRIYFLIDNRLKFPAPKRPLIVGAVRYFMIENDKQPDMTPIIGLDDDVLVVNYVLCELGLRDKCLPLA